MSDLTGISDEGQTLIKRHNHDPELIDYIRERENIIHTVQEQSLKDVSARNLGEKVKLVVCNEPQNCGTVKELEAERNALKEQLKQSEPTDQEKKEMAQAYRERAKEDLEMADAMAGGPVIRDLKSRLVKAQELPEVMRQLAHQAPHPIETVYFQCAKMVEKALGGVSGSTTGKKPRRDGKARCGYPDGASPPCSRCEINDCSVFRKKSKVGAGGEDEKHE